MNPGQQIMMMKIDNGIVIQHPPVGGTSNIVGLAGEAEPQKAQQNTAVFKGSYEELFCYLKSLELFPDEV